MCIVWSVYIRIHPYTSVYIRIYIRIYTYTDGCFSVGVMEGYTSIMTLRRGGLSKVWNWAWEGDGNVLRKHCIMRELSHIMKNEGNPFHAMAYEEESPIVQYRRPTSESMR